ncbi:transcription factor SRM1-like [Amborella trichopoda]|uniref:transcription factor SRM1-like n=1 Tax=Amborella trichopoda TaxID=13333 RepID=UPI0005D451D5|nr:transcription factor SRM1-like [Amborella trichopoda]|eukprot:XP_011625498.1 transcription factor SRM1-like [Amborella trichopoda]
MMKLLAPLLEEVGEMEKPLSEEAIAFSTSSRRRIQLFLAGLKKYPGSDWRSISRHCVKTRTPSQVASHAQKYYERQNSRKEKVKSRYSIHDMELSESELNELEQSGAVPGAAGRCPDQVEQPNLPPSTTMLPSFESPKFEENAGQNVERMPMPMPMPAPTSAIMGQLPIGHAGMPALASYIGGQLPSPLIQSHRLQRDYSGPPRFLPSFSYGDLHEMMKFGS